MLFFDGVCSGPDSERCRYVANYHPPLTKNPPEMTSEHQVALARGHRMPVPSNHISRAARQVVPAFLQKLYELRTLFGCFNAYGKLTGYFVSFIFKKNRMVNDPSNVELIRWSDAGDSFFGAHHLHFHLH